MLKPVLFTAQTETAMNDKGEAGTERRNTGWLWVWAAFVIYFALEVARLS